VLSVVQVLDLLESSDSLSGNVSSSVTGPFSGSGAESRVDLRVQLAVVVLGEDGDVVFLLDDFGVALSSISVTVGDDEGIHPCAELGHVSRILLVSHVKGGIGKSLEK